MTNAVIAVEKTPEINAVVSAPPSKAYTLRALFIASLAKGKSTLNNALHADDQKYAADALSELGAEILFNGNDFLVKGNSGKPVAPEKTLFIGNSGVSARFLSSYASLAEGKTIIDGNERMRERPIKTLIEALKKLGVHAKAAENGCPPIEVNGPSMKGGKTTIDAKESSQYISSILIAAPYAKKDIEIEVEGVNSAPYIDITIDCMKEFGVEVKKTSKGYLVKAGQKYESKEYEVEGDYSSASYFFAAAAVTKGKVMVKNLTKNSLQPDSAFPHLLKRMGCVVSYGKNFVEIQGKQLKGIEVNMSDSPDIVPSLAVVAALAEGKTKITGVKNLRIKESDRIKAICNELTKCGIKTEELDDGMIIEGTTPDKIKETEIETYNDHRIAMAFSVLGLAIGKLKIKNPECVKKSFPQFFEALSSLKKPRNIILIGYRGAGKTTLAKRIAKELGIRWEDSDYLIEEETGKNISDIFKEEGEEKFREHERKIIKKLDGLNNTVIALGGGAIKDKRNIEYFKNNSMIVYLEGSAETLHQRTKNSKRPRLTNDNDLLDEIKQMLAKRKPLYEKAADSIINTDKGFDDTAEELIRLVT